MSGTVILAPQWLGRSGLVTVDPKGRRKPVDAEDLGLSEALADQIETWMDAFDAIYDEHDEAASRFADPQDELNWLAEGDAIAKAISVELGAGWTVEADLVGWRKEAGL